MSKVPILIDSSDSSNKKVGINISSNKSTLSDNFEVEGKVSIKTTDSDTVALLIAKSDDIEKQTEIYNNYNNNEFIINPKLSNNDSYISFKINDIDTLKIDNNGEISIGNNNYGNSGQVLVSNGTGNSVSWETKIDTIYNGGTGVTINNSNEISIGQVVGSSDSPTFNQLSLVGSTNSEAVLNLKYNINNVIESVVEIKGEKNANGGILSVNVRKDDGSLGEALRIKEINQNLRVGIGVTDPRETVEVDGYYSSNRGMITYVDNSTDYRSLIANFTTRTGTTYSPSIYMGEIGGTTRHGFDFKYDNVAGGDTTNTILRMYRLEDINENVFQVFAQSLYPTSWGTSDDRLKTEETDITDGLSVVRQMSPEMYKKWDNFEHTGNYKVESGYIAQEIESIPQLSHCVKELDGIKYINYDYLMAFHTAAIKQLDQRITDLENNKNYESY